MNRRFYGRSVIQWFFPLFFFCAPLTAQSIHPLVRPNSPTSDMTGSIEEKERAPGEEGIGSQESEVTEVTDESKGSEKVRIRIFNNPTAAMQFYRAETVDELSLVTERFMEVVRLYDMVDAKTFIPVMYAFLEALDRAQNHIPLLGFEALRQAQTQGMAFEKFSPIKAGFINLMADNLLSVYLAGQEVWHSTAILEKLVSSGHMTDVNERLLVGMIIRAYAGSGANINQFLMDRVVRPILERNSAFHAELKEHLGKDLLTDALFKIDIRGGVMEQILRDQAAKSAESRVDLVESREGAIPGRVEDPKTERARQIEIIRARQAARRGKR